MKTKEVPEFLNLIQEDLEAWFLETVRHMSSVYGTRLQMVTLLVSLAIAGFANFDVINITVRLWETSKYAEVLPLVEKTKQAMEPVDIKQFTTLPVGWHIQDVPSSLPELIIKLVGLYLGAYFIVIGSQYAYNLIKKQYQPSK